MTNDEVLRRFGIKDEFKTAWQLWDPNLRKLFLRLASVIHNTGLDWYPTEGRGAFRFGCKNRDNDKAYSVAGYVGVRNNSIRIKSNDDWKGKQINAIPQNRPVDLDKKLMKKIEDELGNWNGIPNDLRNKGDGLWPDQFKDHASETAQDDETRSAEASPHHSLNTILYGPPGTGKTYATFRRCVEICDKAIPPDEKAVGDRYRELVEERRVEFVTFHQSYGYEEFVEGLRPQTDSTDTEDGSGAGFRLDPEDGVLKRIAQLARNVPTPSASPLDLDHWSVFKMGLGNPFAADEQGIFEECIENGYALLGWGGNVDWSETTFDQHEEVLKRWNEEESDATGYNPNVKFINCFRNLLKEGDLIVVPMSQQKFRAVGSSNRSVRI